MDLNDAGVKLISTRQSRLEAVKEESYALISKLLLCKTTDSCEEPKTDIMSSNSSSVLSLSQENTHYVSDVQKELEMDNMSAKKSFPNAIYCGGQIPKVELFEL